MLIMVMTFVLLILPLLTSAIRYQVMRIRQQQVKDILSASLPSAYLGVKANDLSEGRLILDPEKASDLIRSMANKNADLSGLGVSLTGLNVMFENVSRPEEPYHWLSGNRPEAMPLIRSTAQWLFPDDMEMITQDQIELVLD